MFVANICSGVRLVHRFSMLDLAAVNPGNASAASTVFRSPGSGGVKSVAYVSKTPAAGPVAVGIGARAAGRCPDCGAPLERTEGCLLCRRCGYSPCA